MTNDQRDEKLTEIHTAVTMLATEAQEDRRRMAEVRTVIFGNGKPGHVLDIDRLKRFNKTECWFFTAIVLGAIGLVCRLVYHNITS